MSINNNNNNNNNTNNKLNMQNNNNGKNHRGIVRNAMPAPLPLSKRQKSTSSSINLSSTSSSSSSCSTITTTTTTIISSTTTSITTSRCQEPPRLADFEDRLKSIITSALNEDQQNRTKAQNQFNNINSKHNNNNTAKYLSYPNLVPKIEEKLQNYIISPLTTTTTTAPIVTTPTTISKNSMKYVRCETVVKQNDITIYNNHHNNLNHQEGLAGIMECYNRDDMKLTPHIKTVQSQQQQQQTNLVEQPDYTQVSPAKLALRRHLSQEKLAAQTQQHHQQNHSLQTQNLINHNHHNFITSTDGILATRTIGDLMCGEIERTLEISNQSIINAAVDMSDIQGTTTLTSRNVVNANLPPRPERVKVSTAVTTPLSSSLLTTTTTSPINNNNNNNDQQQKDLLTTTTTSISTTQIEPLRQVYSPISRPSSTEGLEGLAYMHSHVKLNNNSTINHNYIVPLSQHSPRTVQYSPRTTTVLYPPRSGSVNSNYSSTTIHNNNNNNNNNNEHYTPLPRADIKPYHESYFSDVKPPTPIIENHHHNLYHHHHHHQQQQQQQQQSNLQHTQSPIIHHSHHNQQQQQLHRNNFVAEGLAASLQARVLNGPQIKEETIDIIYDNNNRRLSSSSTSSSSSIISSATNYTTNNNILLTNYNEIKPQLVTNLQNHNKQQHKIKDEHLNVCQYKKGLPLIQNGVVRNLKRSHFISNGDNQITTTISTSTTTTNVISVQSQIINRSINHNNNENESHSNTSTPLVDEVHEPPQRIRKCNDEDVEVEEEGEESKWQDRISSGFERLVAFASTELDKRRRSTEGTDSCNTSPDSGIGHGDNGSSASSSSSSLSTSSINIQPIKQTIKLNPNSKPTLFKMPINKPYLESPPIIDNINDDGETTPRTPSPTSPLNVVPFSPDLNIDKSPSRCLNPALLKYQRHTEEKKSKPDTHYKKKFYYREQWREDNWQKPDNNINNNHHHHHHHHHHHYNNNNNNHHNNNSRQETTTIIKDKFRPKGKDWNWNKTEHNTYLQHHQQQQQQIIGEEWSSNTNNTNNNNGNGRDRYCSWKN